MPKFRTNLIKKYFNEYDLSIKKSFSEPKIYDANGDVGKRWYVYFSYRNALNNKLERQAPVYAGINEIKEYQKRKKAVKVLCEAVNSILKNGYNPFTDEDLFNKENIKMNIPEAITFVLQLKKNSLAESSFIDFKTRIKVFEKWLLKNGFENRYVTVITKKAVIAYLNTILVATSPRNRNNTRSNLSMFFQALEDNEIIIDNFVKKINVLKAAPKRNKTYSLKQVEDLFLKLDEKNNILLLFIKFISYNHLRPIEVVRLKIKDINIDEKIVNIRAKNKIVKRKLIPSILLDEMPNLTCLDSESYLFTPDGFGKEWNTTETNKRNFFSKQFNKIKKELKLGSDYGLYSFRHTFITKLYNNLLVNSTPFEAKSKLMLITGHETMTALEKYLRDIDAVLPDDYSEFLK